MSQEANGVKIRTSLDDALLITWFYGPSRNSTANSLKLSVLVTYSIPQIYITRYEYLVLFAPREMFTLWYMIEFWCNILIWFTYNCYLRHIYLIDARWSICPHCSLIYIFIETICRSTKGIFWESWKTLEISIRRNMNRLNKAKGITKNVNW